MRAVRCGSMWRPYFASAAWDPFANGTWAWYQGAGYSWVSPYPWGWTPYHSGSWAYCDNVGWGWMPGGGWNGLNNVAGLSAAQNTVAGAPVRIPHTPTQPPLPHGASLIPVNNKPLAASEIASPTSFVFRKDSAGLGVPRETLGHLGKFSNQVVDEISSGWSSPVNVVEHHQERAVSGQLLEHAAKGPRHLLAGALGEAEAERGGDDVRDHVGVVGAAEQPANALP